MLDIFFRVAKVSFIMSLINNSGDHKIKLTVYCFKIVNEMIKLTFDVLSIKNVTLQIEEFCFKNYKND